jgi:hypothetical protein
MGGWKYWIFLDVRKLNEEKGLCGVVAQTAEQQRAGSRERRERKREKEI